MAALEDILAFGQLMQYMTEEQMRELISNQQEEINQYKLTIEALESKTSTSDETIEKLNSYIATSFAQQSKKEAVNQLGNSLRAMGSDEAQNLLNGSADFNQVMRFVENNKNIPEGSKEMLLGIYGIGSRTKYFYNNGREL